VKTFALRNVLVLLTVLAAPVAGVDAQARRGLPPTDDLYRTVASLDAAMFDAFNRCDLEAFGSLIADDVEFYHDKGGLMRSRQSVVEAIKNNVCGKLRRELVAGTLEVYPMEGYGAVEIGVHRFYELKGAHPDQPSGEAKFIHLWRNTNGVWQLARVISYDHGPVTK
jgi:hypothetical protein